MENVSLSRPAFDAVVRALNDGISQQPGISAVDLSAIDAIMASSGTPPAEAARLHQALQQGDAVTLHSDGTTLLLDPGQVRFPNPGWRQQAREWGEQLPGVTGGGPNKLDRRVSDYQFHRALRASAAGPESTTHLANTEGLTVAGARALNRDVLDRMLGSSTSLAHRLAANGYSRDLIQRATLGSALYECLGQNVGDSLDRLSSARDRLRHEVASLRGRTAEGSASVGPFQAYAAETAKALVESPDLLAWLARADNPDTSARDFARQYVNRVPAASQETLTLALEGPLSPLHSSNALSMIGKTQLTLDYMQDVHNATHGRVRDLDAESQLRIFAEAESGRRCTGAGFTSQFGTEPARIVLPPLSARVTETLDTFHLPVNHDSTVSFRPSGRAFAPIP